MIRLLFALPLASAVPPPFTGFKLTGNLTTSDLIAASTNALNGALLARRPDHYRNSTVVGVLLMAILIGVDFIQIGRREPGTPVVASQAEATGRPRPGRTDR